ncbi:hypothetical protein [Nostoc sp. ChiSLP03a]|uniref:hypothetical protein n=1 Tax=Nostoc sp. ChiSLP03a TaxID=3075380 RepID=UPI002AD4D536|nr:hypothetical protein [Nostoc sp. ChiSLP03a]MDZ8213138.1 hypothetical protein [Nostoc sp. ChiSLP03a]
MIFKQKPNFRDVALSVVAGISLLGLLGLAFVDSDSRQAFLNMATFTIGAVVGHFIPVQK